MTYSKRAAALVLSLALSGVMGVAYAQNTNDDMRKADAAQASSDKKQDAKQTKADKKQVKADKAKQKELNSGKAANAAQSQDKADAAKDDANNR